jgi:hypothetical protein
MLTLKKFLASLFECDVGSRGIAHNVFRLCAVGVLEVGCSF